MKSAKEIGFRDLPSVRDALRGYRDYRRAKGLEPSSYWVDRVSDELARQGFPMRRGATAENDAGRDDRGGSGGLREPGEEPDGVGVADGSE